MFLKMCIFFDYGNVEFTLLDSLPIVIFTKQFLSWWCRIYIQCIFVIFCLRLVLSHPNMMNFSPYVLSKSEKLSEKVFRVNYSSLWMDHIRSWGAQMHLWGFYCHFPSCNKNGGSVVSVLSLTSSLMFHMHIDNEGLYMIIIQMGL